MYAPKIVVQQVIKLFVDEPKFRDDRYGTIEEIVNRFYLSSYGNSICIDFKLMTDIDRAFRYIQQYEPSLRGETWLKRQRQAGEISKEDFEKLNENEIEDIVKQLHLF